MHPVKIIILIVEEFWIGRGSKGSGNRVTDGTDQNNAQWGGIVTITAQKKDQDKVVVQSKSGTGY